MARFRVPGSRPPASSASTSLGAPLLPAPPAAAGRPQPGADDRVGVGSEGGRHPGRQRRRRQLVIGREHQGRLQHRLPFRSDAADG